MKNKIKLIKIFSLLVLGTGLSYMQCIAKTEQKTKKKVSDLFMPQPSDNFRVVEEGKLYRSAQLSAERLEEYINHYQIKTIINLRGQQKKRWWQEELVMTQKHHVNYQSLNMDAACIPSRKDLLALLEAFEKAPRPILIHCLHGENRTGLAAAVWELDQQGKSKEEAQKQLGAKHELKYPQPPAQAFFLNIWQSRAWAIAEYNPKNYPAIYSTSVKSIQA